jgi:hypothetical protein
MRPFSRPLALVARLAVLLSFSTTGHGQHGLSPPGKIVLDGVVSVPMESVEGRLVIVAKLNGRGPFKFILDSGAAVSLLADTFVHEAGFPVTGEMKVGSPGSKVPKMAGITSVERLEIGNLAVERSRGSSE